MMKEEVLQVFREIATKIKVISPFQLTLQEQIVQSNGVLPHNKGVFLLKDVIYQAFYSQETEVYLANLNNTTLTSDPTTKQQFIEQLSTHNQSVNGWDLGWIVHLITPQGQVYARKNEQLRLLEPGKFRLLDSSRPLQPMSEVHILKEREFNDAKSVFYFVNGNALIAQTPHIARFYWNITPEGAPLLIRLLTQHLNEYKVPFQFKCLNDPALYIRKDAAVLYIEKRHFKITMGLLEELIGAMTPFLKNPTPLFTKVLHTGLSFGENPLDQQNSFGMHRSHMIAEGLWNAFLTGKHTVEEKVEAMTEVWLRNHMSLDQPFLNPLSQFPYSFTFEPAMAHELN